MCAIGGRTGTPVALAMLPRRAAWLQRRIDATARAARARDLLPRDSARTGLVSAAGFRHTHTASCLRWPALPHPTGAPHASGVATTARDDWCADGVRRMGPTGAAGWQVGAVATALAAVASTAACAVAVACAGNSDEGSDSNGQTGEGENNHGARPWLVGVDRDCSASTSESKRGNENHGTAAGDACGRPRLTGGDGGVGDGGVGDADGEGGSGGGGGGSSVLSEDRLRAMLTHALEPARQEARAAQVPFQRLALHLQQPSPLARNDSSEPQGGGGRHATCAAIAMPLSPCTPGTAVRVLGALAEHLRPAEVTGLEDGTKGGAAGSATLSLLLRDSRGSVSGSVAWVVTDGASKVSRGCRGHADVVRSSPLSHVPRSACGLRLTTQRGSQLVLYRDAGFTEHDVKAVAAAYTAMTRHAIAHAAQAQARVGSDAASENSRRTFGTQQPKPGSAAAKVRGARFRVYVVQACVRQRPSAVCMLMCPLVGTRGYKARLRDCAQGRKHCRPQAAHQAGCASCVPCSLRSTRMCGGWACVCTATARLVSGQRWTGRRWLAVTTSARCVHHEGDTSRTVVPARYLAVRFTRELLACLQAIETNLLLQLRHPETYAAVTKATRARTSASRNDTDNRVGAALFTGPPGTGKTTVARIIAGEADIPMVR